MSRLWPSRIDQIQSWSAFEAYWSPCLRQQRVAFTTAYLPSCLYCWFFSSILPGLENECGCWPRTLENRKMQRLAHVQAVRATLGMPFRWSGGLHCWHWWKMLWAPSALPTTGADQPIPSPSAGGGCIYKSNWNSSNCYIQIWIHSVHKWIKLFC